MGEFWLCWHIAHIGFTVLTTSGHQNALSELIVVVDTISLAHDKQNGFKAATEWWPAVW